MSPYLEPSDSQIGKLFPLWVVRQFRNFILGKEETLKEGEDPCAVLPKHQRALRPYQAFLGQYLNAQSPFQGILVYHGLGSGKTAGAIHLLSVLNSHTDYNIFILLPASLQPTWQKEMNSWLDGELKPRIKKNTHFIATNASNTEDQFFDAVKRADVSRPNCYIVEEAHNFIHNVFSNIKSGSVKHRALNIYNHIQTDLTVNNETRVVLLSGTPIRSDPFEVSLLFNLLRPGSFPQDEGHFTDLFLTISGEGSIPSLNPKQVSLFQRRILGLVSFFRGSSPLLYARREVQFVDLPMSPTQEEAYNFFEAIEKKQEAQALARGRKSAQGFKTTTRLAGNFVSPVDATRRPRPKHFRLSSKEDLQVLSGSSSSIHSSDDPSVKQYQNACQDYLSKVVSYFHKLDTKELEKDLAEFSANNNKMDFKSFLRSEGRSKTFNLLCACSVKMTAALFYCWASPGGVVFYSNFVMMEGIQVFKLFLGLTKRLTFVEYHGGIDKETRKQNLREFNKGEARVMLLSSAGSEGISLKNVRTVVILEPNWNEDVVQQVIGRAIRQCSHRSLPMSERVVAIYRLKAIRAKGSKTTDQEIESTAMQKHALKSSFLDAIKGAAVDCDLFKNQNSNDVQCFRFPALEQLAERPGPAFLKELIDDQEEGVGAYQNVKLKVRKIQAVLGDSPKKPSLFLFDEETGIAYDPEFHLPVGRVHKDDKGFYDKVDPTTFMISEPITLY